MGATLPSLADMLAEAQLAFHRLNIGQSFVRVTDGAGRMTEFTPADIDKLQAYIDSLQAQISGTRTKGAIVVVF